MADRKRLPYLPTTRHRKTTVDDGRGYSTLPVVKEKQFREMMDRHDHYMQQRRWDGLYCVLSMIEATEKDTEKLILRLPVQSPVASKKSLNDDDSSSGFGSEPPSPVNSDTSSGFGSDTEHDERVDIADNQQDDDDDDQEEEAEALTQRYRSTRARTRSFHSDDVPQFPPQHVFVVTRSGAIFRGPHDDSAPVLCVNSDGDDKQRVFRVSDQFVSARHLQIDVTNNEFFAMDVGSLNGTFYRPRAYVSGHYAGYEFSSVPKATTVSDCDYIVSLPQQQLSHAKMAPHVLCVGDNVLLGNTELEIVSVTDDQLEFCEFHRPANSHVVSTTSGCLIGSGGRSDVVFDDSSIRQHHVFIGYSQREHKFLLCDVYPDENEMDVVCVSSGHFDLCTTKDMQHRNAPIPIVEKSLCDRFDRFMVRLSRPHVQSKRVRLHSGDVIRFGFTSFVVRVCGTPRINNEIDNSLNDVVTDRSPPKLVSQRRVSLAEALGVDSSGLYRSSLLDVFTEPGTSPPQQPTPAPEEEELPTPSHESPTALPLQELPGADIPVHKPMNPTPMQLRRHSEHTAAAASSHNASDATAQLSAEMLRKASLGECANKVKLSDIGVTLDGNFMHREEMEDRASVVTNFGGPDNVFLGVYDGHGGRFVGRLVADFCAATLHGNFYDRLLQCGHLPMWGIPRSLTRTVSSPRMAEGTTLSPPVPASISMYSSLDTNQKRQSSSSIPMIGRATSEPVLHQPDKRSPRSSPKHGSSQPVDDADVEETPLSEVGKALYDAFSDTTQQCIGLGEVSQYGGTTAVVCFIYNDSTGTTRLVCANAGDSHGIICHSKRALLLTQSHKPDAPRELGRITRAGGRVANGRLTGMLTVSRALGDLSMHQFGLSAEPHIIEIPLDDEVTHVVLASDGVWDVVSFDDVASLACRKENEHATAQNLSDILVELAVNRGTQDNLACIVAKLMKTSTTQETTS